MYGNLLESTKERDSALHHQTFYLAVTFPTLVLRLQSENGFVMQITNQMCTGGMDFNFNICILFTVFNTEPSQR